MQKFEVDDDLAALGGGGWSAATLRETRFERCPALRLAKPLVGLRQAKATEPDEDQQAA